MQCKKIDAEDYIVLLETQLEALRQRRKTRKNEMNKIKFHPWVLLCIFTILFFINTVCIKGNEYLNIQGDYEEQNINDYMVNFFGYKIDEYGYFNVENEDSQLLFDFTKLDSKVHGISIDFENELNLSSIQLYYGRDDLDFSETDSEHFQGKSKHIEEISFEGYSYIRLDINEKFKISEFKIAKKLIASKVDFKNEYILLLIISAIISILFSFSEKIDNLFKKKCLVICRKCKSIKYKWKEILKLCISIIFIIFLAVAIENLLTLIKEREYVNKYRMLIIFCILTIIGLSLRYYKFIKNYMHIYFFILCMMVGTVHVIAAPPALGISWDDEIHYGRTAYLSRGAVGYISDNDNTIVSRYAKIIMEKDVYNYIGRLKWEKEINENIIGNRILIKTNMYILGHTYITYIPAAFGLNLGRCLGLNFIHTFMLGKWMNLFVYSFVFAYSVKLLKRGSILVALIGLIPTSIFMAASYSYDWWVISLCVLGYSLFIHELQSEQKINIKKFIIIMLIMVIAILPKAVYFVLIFPMMCLKKEKYENAKFCRMAAIIAMMILIASFVLPMFIEGVGEGDVRGGYGVNATEQMIFVLNHPIEYGKILIKFLLKYLSLDSANRYLTSMAYYGKAEYYTVCILLMGIAAVLDNVTIDNTKNGSIFFKLSVIISVAASIVLVATALYINYTPVRYETVSGCQPRYLLPLIFPCIYFISELNLNVSEKLKSNIYIFGTSIMSFIFLYGIYDMCIRYY